MSLDQWYINALHMSTYGDSLSLLLPNLMSQQKTSSSSTIALGSSVVPSMLNGNTFIPKASSPKASLVDVNPGVKRLKLMWAYECLEHCSY